MLMLPTLMMDLEGRLSPSRINYAPGASATYFRNEILTLLRSAECFDFGALHFERDEEEKAWVIPDITKDEMDWWQSGLIPLPAPVCWFEFALENRSGLLVTATGPYDWRVMRLDYCSDRSFNLVDAIWVRRGPDPKNARGTQYHLIGPAKAMKVIRRHETHFISYMTPGGNFNLSLYFALMLSSRTTEIRVEKPSDKMMKAREVTGLLPMPEHRVVNIIPAHYVDREDKGGHHASPKLHWRRSHLRQLRAPSGEVYHRVVIPRCLVGRRELGEITHEYKVKGGN